MGFAESKEFEEEKDEQQEGSKNKQQEHTPEFSQNDIKQLQQQTNFQEVEVQTLYSVFTKQAVDGAVDRDRFKESLSMLETAGLKDLKNSPFADRLFDLLDSNGDGVVDLSEFITGLSMVCKGSMEEKLLLSFKAYDQDGNGFIDEAEMTALFKAAWLSGYKTLCVTHPQQDLSLNDFNEYCREMALIFTAKAFSVLDTDNDGKLSFEEFKEFAMQEPKITATLNGFKQEVAISF